MLVDEAGEGPSNVPDNHLLVRNASPNARLPQGRPLPARPFAISFSADGVPKVDRPM